MPTGELDSNDFPRNPGPIRHLPLAPRRAYKQKPIRPHRLQPTVLLARQSQGNTFSCLWPLAGIYRGWVNFIDTSLAYGEEGHSERLVGEIVTSLVIYNIFDQTPEKTLFPLCREKNIGVIARVPFDEGALTGRITEDATFDDKDFRVMYFRGDRKREVAQHVDALIKDLEISVMIHRLSRCALSRVIRQCRQLYRECDRLVACR